MDIQFIARKKEETCLLMKVEFSLQCTCWFVLVMPTTLLTFSNKRMCTAIFAKHAKLAGLASPGSDPIHPSIY